MYRKTFRTPRRAFAVSAFLLSIFAANIVAQTPQLSVREIMAEPSIAGMRATEEKLSPDGKWCAYLWSASGKEPRDIYVVATTGGAARILVRAIDERKGANIEALKREEAKRDETQQNEPKRVEAMRDDKSKDDDAAARFSGLEWSPDSRKILYARGGDLFVVAVDARAAKPQRLTKTVAPELAARWTPDGRAIIFQSNGQFFRLNLDSPQLIQLTHEGATGARNENASSQTNTQPNPSSITGAFLSENGSHLAYILSDTSKLRALIVPNYTGEFVVANTARRGWSEQVLKIVDASGENEKPLSVKLPAPEGVSYIRGVKWGGDEMLVIDRIDKDTKRRQLFLANVSDGNVRLIDEETDAKWIAPLSRIVEIAPDGKTILFASERDGFNHLYVAQLNRGDNGGWMIKQLTRGAWEVSWAKFLPDGQRVVFSSTAKSTAERHFSIVDVRSANPAPPLYPLIQLPDPDGMNAEPQLSKDGAMLLVQNSKYNLPSELYAMRVCADCNRQAAPIKLTDTVPVRFKQIAWTRPQFVEYKAKDGKRVKARVYLPSNFDKSKKYPAILFVHGAGYLQNVVNGWNNYYREAMFNTLLNKRGYVVLDADYRGSLGYGREWRTDVYDFLGGLDLQDELDGIDFIVKNFSVDAARVGMYGGSYGGFMAEMAAMRAPEKINCAAALRPVADWKNYYASSPVYTTERLGFPDKNTEGYRRSSPISYADKLQRPLLILHGMVDDNVHFQDSVQLVEKLIELGKTAYFEVMVYPKENHAFTKPESWTDEYERILRFFDSHLRDESSRGMRTVVNERN